MIPKGARIFPLVPGSKVPKTPRGHLDAVRAPLVGHPSSNYGIVLDGQWLLVDIDHEHPERSALESSLPETWEQITPRSSARGRHLLYSVPTGFQGAFKRVWRGPDDLPIADIKCGGYLVGPSSTIGGVPYRLVNAMEPVPAPQFLLDFMFEEKSDRIAVENESQGGIPNGDHDRFLHTLASWLRGQESLSESTIARVLQNGPLAALQDVDTDHPYTQDDCSRIAHSVASYAPQKGLELVEEEPEIVMDCSFDLPMLDWYIPDFIPRGGNLLTAYAPGGTGKSSFGHYLASLVTQEQHKFLLVNHEDHPEYWKACAVVSGADPTYLGHYSMPLSLKFPQDAARLEEIIVKHDFKVVWFDSIKDHLKERDGDAGERARSGLSPLADIAQRTGCLIIGIFHTNKKGLPGGSTEFLNVARHVIEFSRKPNQLLTLRIEKSNIDYPPHVLKMLGEKKELVDPRDSTRALKVKTKEGVVKVREAWITTGYEEDSEALQAIEDDLEMRKRDDAVQELHSQGLSQRTIAEKLGISQSSVSRILKGTQTYSIEERF